MLTPVILQGHLSRRLRLGLTVGILLNVSAAAMRAASLASARTAGTGGVLHAGGNDGR